MKTLVKVLTVAILSTQAVYADDLTPPEPVKKPGVVKVLVQKAGHYTRKVLVFPLYVGGGAAVGFGAWCLFGGHEKQVCQAVAQLVEQYSK